MNRSHPAILLFVACIPLLLSGGCRSSEATTDSPLIYDIGVVGRDITTHSADAQLWFNRGLGLSFGFNHDEAVACFEKAIQADPKCAMAYFGMAYALGPNYNAPIIPDEASLAAAQAASRALAELDDETPAEQALVMAIQHRYATPPPADRSGLDLSFANAMRDVQSAYPDDPEVCAITVESYMQLKPWALWSPGGVAAEGTVELLNLLESGLAKWPNHPALCHLYVHAMEAGPKVEKAIPVARRMEKLTPGLGHLVHMPSHIYVGAGLYDDVVRVNLDAVRIDDAFVKERGRKGFYTAYRIHNYHFVAYGAMWEGRKRLALSYARAIPGEIPPPLLDAAPEIFDIFFATPYHVMVRFGLWDEILEEPKPAAKLVATLPVWHYARGVAYASLGRVAEAEQELEKFEQSAALVPEGHLLFQNPVHEVLKVARKVLVGEILYRKGAYEPAFASLREAVVLDEQLNYDEPWGWMEPARHALGALLTEQGRYEEAKLVYEKNLARYPENGWALHGLAECLDRLGRHEESVAVGERFGAAWARADTAIPGSCFCRTK